MTIKRLRDRGTIKWTSIFLPEHVEMLREYMIEYDKTQKPILDEYEIAEIETKIQYAYEARLPLKFRYWRDGFEGEVTGRIRKIDALTKEMRLEGAVKLRLALRKRATRIESPLPFYLSRFIQFTEHLIKRRVLIVIFRNRLTGQVRIPRRHALVNVAKYRL
jgi:hypothetical protein